MNELTSNNKSAKPFSPSPANDAAGLNALVKMANESLAAESGLPPEKFNAQAGRVLSAAESEKLDGILAEANRQGDARLSPEPILFDDVPETKPAARAALPPAPANLNRVFYTGRFKSGKDFVAAATGAKIFSLAEPLYALQEYFFGKQDKDAHGAREFLQKVGQWGRGEVSAKYPLTPERAAFVEEIRNSKRISAAVGLSVEWSRFGDNNNLWLKALIARVDEHLVAFPDQRVAVTNVRFENEYRKLSEAGWTSYHVTAGPKTWIDRLAAVGLTPDGPSAKDASEQLAAGIDLDINRRLSRQPNGSKLRVIWSDEKSASPSRRLYSVAEYVAMFKH